MKLNENGELILLKFRCKRSTLENLFNKLPIEELEFKEVTTVNNIDLLEISFCDEIGNDNILYIKNNIMAETVRCEPFMIGNKSYFKSTGIWTHSLNILKSICVEVGGDLKAIDCNGNTHLILNGIEVEENKIDIVKSKLRLKDLEDEIAEQHIYSVQEYIESEEELRQQLEPLHSPIERVNALGKYLLNQKLNNKIFFDKFRDLFLQVANMGTKDETLNRFLKILK